jgi:hypothetical protein
MKRPGPHPHVVRLQDDASLRAPVIVERQDETLEAEWFLVGHNRPGIGEAGRAGQGCDVFAVSWPGNRFGIVTIM